MLLALSEWLEQYARAFNVFGYITLRAVLATMTALVDVLRVRLARSAAVLIRRRDLGFVTDFLYFFWNSSFLSL